MLNLVTLKSEAWKSLYLLKAVCDSSAGEGSVP